MEWHFEIIERTHKFFDGLEVPVSFDVVMVVNDGNSLRTYLVQPCTTKQAADDLLAIVKKLDSWYRKYITGGENAQ